LRGDDFCSHIHTILRQHGMYCVLYKAIAVTKRIQCYYKRFFFSLFGLYCRTPALPFNFTVTSSSTKFSAGFYSVEQLVLNYWETRLNFHCLS
jgi:hypothetical protein